MKRMVNMLLILLCTGTSARTADRAPDILFIVVDDLNDWITLLDPDSRIRTPNLERLAARGTLFTRAYCMSAACNPSRVATLTGLRPTSSGVYGNASDWRKALPRRKTLMQRFRSAGYRVTGAGKIFHHHLGGAFHDDASFEDFRPMRSQLYPTEKLNHAPEYGSRNTDWGAWPPDERDAIDYDTVVYCENALKERKRQRPLFLACGIFKPHSPFFAPKRYHEQLPEVGLPPRREADRDDLPVGALRLMASKEWFWQGMMSLETRRPGSYQSFVRSYAACVAYADAQIGRVLDALDASGRADRTIVVLWSDHGFHLGEKNHIEKFALWEKTNHIPLIIVAPGVTAPGSQCRTPVDLSVLYPTLLDLAGLQADPYCDGHSVRPLLRGESAGWKTPALMTYGRGNHAVRTDRWRYIRYADGTEELYDHDADPSEWDNLAGRPEHVEEVRRLKTFLPRQEADPVANLKRRQK